DIVNIFFVLVSLGIEVKGRGVSHVTTGFIGNDGDVIPYLTLIRIALEGIKRIADSNVRRPGHAGVSAKGIEKLRVRVVRSVARIIPDSVEPSIGGYCECAEPVPLVRINRVVIDLDRRAKS